MYSNNCTKSSVLGLFGQEGGPASSFRCDGDSETSLARFEREWGRDRLGKEQSLAEPTPSSVRLVDSRAEPDSNQARAQALLSSAQLVLN